MTSSFVMRKTPKMVPLNLHNTVRDGTFHGAKKLPHNVLSETYKVHLQGL
jgi:hypothetical protein